MIHGVAHQKQIFYLIIALVIISGVGFALRMF